MMEVRHPVAGVQASVGTENYKVDLQAGRHRLTADEPATRGGADAGAAPYELLLSGLAACTAITLRMVAERKGWDLRAVEVEARLFKHHEQAHIERTLLLHGELTPEQRARLLDVSERTPVTLTLKGGIEISTTLR
jgi:putative redox protein